MAGDDAAAAGVRDAPPAATSAAPAAAAAAAADAADPAAQAKKKQQQTQQPDQRPPRLPMPDPIPEEPVKRYHEPSRTELQERINAIDAKVQLCFDRLKASKAYYDQRTKIRDDAKPAFDKARVVMTQSNDALKALFDKKKEITAKIKAIKDAEMGGTTGTGLLTSGGAGPAAGNGSGAGEGGGGSSKDANAALRGCRTIEDVNNRIHELEQRQMSSSISLQEEKKLVSQISFLNSKGRDYIESKDKAFKDEKALKDKRIAERKELEEQRKALDLEIDAAKVVADANRLAVDRLRAEQEEKVRAITEANKDFDREAEKNKITEFKKEIKTLRETFHKDHDKWFLNERIFMEQQKIAKRKRWEAAQAEREAKRLAWEAEMAQYPVADPYQPEKDMCSALTFHLQNLMGTPTELCKVIKADSTTSSLLPAAASKPTLKKGAGAAGESREIAKGAGKSIGKTVMQETTAFENDAYGVFATKAASKKGRRGRRSDFGMDPLANGNAVTDTTSADDHSVDDDVKLKPHALEHLTYFENLGIKAPTRRSELKTTLDLVLKKKEYFENDPPSKEDQPQEESSRGEEAKSSKKSTSMHQEPSRKHSSSVSVPDGAAAFPDLKSAAASETDAVTLVRPVEGDSANRPSFSDIARGHARPREMAMTSSEPAFPMPGVNGMTKPVAVAETSGFTDLSDTISAPISATTSAPAAGATVPSGIAGTVGN